MQNFWFNFLEGKGGRNKNMNEYEQRNVIFIKTLGSLESRRVPILLFTSLFSTVKAVLSAGEFTFESFVTCYFDKFLKFQIMGRDRREEASSYRYA